MRACGRTGGRGPGRAGRGVGRDKTGRGVAWHGGACVLRHVRVGVRGHTGGRLRAGEGGGGGPRRACAHAHGCVFGFVCACAIY